MSSLTRFGISLEKELLKQFDTHIKSKNYKNRSEAFRDLIRENLIKSEWMKGTIIAGAIILVYDHHKRELVSKLTDIQHDFHDIIISSQHIHFDHCNCFEIIAAKGKPSILQKLSNKLKSTKGVKFCAFTAATTGEKIV